MSTNATNVSFLDRFINAIHVLETRSYLRSRRFFLTFLLSLTASCIIFLFVVFFNIVERTASDQVGKTLFFTICILQYISICVIFPAFSCTAIIGEKERKTFELLVATDLKPSEIIWGKFLSAFTNAFLFLFSTLPIMMVSFLFGGITPSLIVMVYGGLLAISCLVIFFSLAISCFYRSITRAIISSYILIGIISFPLGVGFIALIEDYLYGRELLQFFAQVGYTSFNGFMILYVSPLVIFLVLTSFPYILASNALKPVSTNRSTILRLYFLVSTLSLLVLALSFLCYNCYVEIIAKGKLIDDDIMYPFAIITYIVIGLICIIPTMIFSSENPRQSLFILNRMREFCKKRFFLRVFMREHVIRLLAPGAFSGALYCSLVSLVLFTVAFFTLFVLSDGFKAVQQSSSTQGPIAFLNSALVLWSFLTFLAMFSCYISFRVRRKNVRRVIILCVVIVLVIILPLYMLISTSIDQGHFRASVTNLQYLSPPVSFYTAWEAPKRISRSNWNLHLFPGLIDHPDFGRGIPLHYLSILIFFTASFLLCLKNIQLNKRIWDEQSEQEKELATLDAELEAELAESKKDIS